MSNPAEAPAPPEHFASLAAALAHARAESDNADVRATLRDACTAYLRDTAPQLEVELASPPTALPNPTAAPSPVAPSPIAAAITAAIETLRRASPERRLDIALDYVRSAHQFASRASVRAGGAR